MECTSTGAYVLHYLVKGNKASIMDIPKLRNEEEGGDKSIPSYILQFLLLCLLTEVVKKIRLVINFIIS